MKILCLYNNPCALGLFEWLDEKGHEVVIWSGKLDAGWCRKQGFDLTVSYTYRYILTADILSALDRCAVNIHTSYLPWNRGADPNMWSILEGTPRGVTLHYMDEALDKGDIIAQALLPMAGEEDTLSSTYTELDRLAKKLFMAAFSYYRMWPEMKKSPVSGGSYHSIDDGRRIKDMVGTYDINVMKLKRLFGGISKG